MFGLIGPDGAGKTTTIRLACGLLAPLSGRIEVGGVDPVRDHRAVTRTVGYLSQRFSLYGDLSVDENIAFFAEIHGLRRFHQRRERLLQMTQLTPFRGRRADRLSGRHETEARLGLHARARAGRRSAGRADDRRRPGVPPRVLEAVVRVLSQGITILTATPVSGRGRALHQSGASSSGAAAGRRSSPAPSGRAWWAPSTRSSRPPIAACSSSFERSPDVIDVQTFGDRAHARIAGDRPGAQDRLRAALQSGGVELIGLRAIQPSLEDVFIDRIARADAAEP